ncbi:hypothetical protein HDU93_008509 [Gonapodya sp. JEL0774]|nr:hypothetical protein HDU93_008509 [Gonapodya sp. JEL0774]
MEKIKNLFHKNEERHEETTVPVRTGAGSAPGLGTTASSTTSGPTSTSATQRTGPLESSTHPTTTPGAPRGTLDPDAAAALHPGTGTGTGTGPGVREVEGTRVTTGEERLTSGQGAQDFTTHRGVGGGGVPVSTHEVRERERERERGATTARAAETSEEIERRYRPPVTHETIKQVEVEDVRPVVNREIFQPQIQQTIQPVTDRRVETERVERVVQPTEVREIKGSTRPEDEARYRRQADSIADSRRELDVERRTVVKEPIVRETIVPQVVEEVQPVIEREVIVPRRVEIEQPVTEKVYEAPRVAEARYAAPVSMSDLGAGGVHREGPLGRAGDAIARTEVKHEVRKDEREMRRETGQGVVGKAQGAVAEAQIRHDVRREEREREKEGHTGKPAGTGVGYTSGMGGDVAQERDTYAGAGAGAGDATRRQGAGAYRGGDQRSGAYPGDTITASQEGLGPAPGVTAKTREQAQRERVVREE